MKTIKAEQITQFFRKFDGTLSVKVDGKWIVMSKSNEEANYIPSLFSKKQLISFNIDEKGDVSNIKFDKFKNVDPEILRKVRESFPGN